MVVDRYTKIVLTLIAGCLLWQCVMAGGRPVAAQQLGNVPAGLLATQAQPVVIVGWGEMSTQGQIALNLKRGANGVVTDTTIPVRLPYTAQNALPVTVASPVRLAYTPERPLPVGVTGIRNATGDWDVVNTSVQSDPVQKTPGMPRP